MPPRKQAVIQNGPREVGIGADGPAKVLEMYLSGEMQQENALSQIFHMFSADPGLVVKAIYDKASFVISSAEFGFAGLRAQVAGQTLVSIAIAIDERTSAAQQGGDAPDVETKEPAKKGGNVCQGLLDHVLHETGSRNRCAKSNAVRAQACALVTSLAAVVPDPQKAESKLLEYVIDKVPSVREKAVRGLAGLTPSPAVELALAGRTKDTCTPVRAAAVRGLRLSPSSSAALLERIDDVEACVRAQLFLRLADQPDAAATIGPAALARLVVGAADRSPAVRQAAGSVVDAWRQHFGGALQLLERCEVAGDEALGEAVARVIAERFTNECVGAARSFLGSSIASAKNLGAKAAVALLTRTVFVDMSDEDRDEFLDVPVLLKRTREVLRLQPGASAKTAKSHVFLLCQLLRAVAVVDLADEGMRRNVEELAEQVLQQAPVHIVCGSTASVLAQSAVDLGMVLLRKAFGLVRVGQQRVANRQAQEVRFSTRVVLLLSDLRQPEEPSAAAAAGGVDETEELGFTERLSRRMQELEAGIDDRKRTAADLSAQKKKAISEDDLLRAHEIKSVLQRTEAELAALTEEHRGLLKERDGHCMRVIAIVSAALRWSGANSLKKDPALYSTLDQIIRPMLSLPALSDDLSWATLNSVCLFCAREGLTAKAHWPLFLTLLRELKRDVGKGGSAAKRRVRRAQAELAARALSDCARLHMGGDLEREEVLAAAQGLATVPFAARYVVLEPLCGWLFSLGHLFFEEHLFEPVLDVQWALGWMLVEAFRQRGGPLADDSEEAEPSAVAALQAAFGGRSSGKPALPDSVSSVAGECQDGEAEEDSPSGDTMAMAARLTQFFTILPKLPGKHGAPMLSLAVESVAENGLWRRAALLPRVVGVHIRWLRWFSWPTLFEFAHQRLSQEMRFRLWRCSLQLCVTDPDLAPLAEVPFALNVAAANGEAPPGAAELVRDAIKLGADKAALASVAARLPDPAPSGKECLLLPRADAEQAEKERRADLQELGVEDLETWAPAHVEIPRETPPQIALRNAPRRNKGAPKRLATAASMQDIGAQASEALVAAAPSAPAAPAAPAEKVEAASPPEASKRQQKPKQKKQDETQQQQEQQEESQEDASTKRRRLTCKATLAEEPVPVQLPLREANRKVA